MQVVDIRGSGWHAPDNNDELWFATMMVNDEITTVPVYAADRLGAFAALNLAHSQGGTM